MERTTAEQERLERARIRIGTILTLASELQAPITPADIRRAPIAKLSPVAIRSAVMGANLLLMAVDNLAFTLAGLADDRAIEALLAGLAPPADPGRL
jgi:hypothetical protein